MKKGIHYWALPTDLTLSEKFRFAKDCGFNGVELALLKEGEFSPARSEKELSEIAKAAQGEGIELPSITNTLSWTCSMTGGSREIRQRAVDVLKQEIDMANAIGASAVLALPGFVSVGFAVNDLHPSTDTQSLASYHPSSETVDYSRAYERALEGFSVIAPYAEAAGVKVCIENIWSNFLLSPIEMRSFLDTLDSDHIKAYFDVGNVYPYGIPQHWIEILGSRIDRVHFKDYVTGSLSPNGFVPLLSGQVDFSAVMTSLRSIRFDGWVTAEVNMNPYCREYVARASSLAMDEIFRL